MGKYQLQKVNGSPLGFPGDKRTYEEEGWVLLVLFEKNPNVMQTFFTVLLILIDGKYLVMLIFVADIL